MQPVRIAPVGTCRIHTPLRRAAKRYPFELALARNYGFVHTSSEVLQQLDLILGGEPVPQALWPLIYRPNTTAEFLSRPSLPADTYFFEISSAKHVTIDGVPIQINYVNRHFSDFFAETEVARHFWSSANDGAAEQRSDWLQTVSQFQRLSADQKALLESIRMSELTPDEIRADMAAIVERVGAEKAVFVTHVNAFTPDGAPIASRKLLIDLVDKIAKKLGVRRFDPTVHMNAFGQINAMERDGLDLTHFTLPFADHLGEDWFHKYIEPLGAKVDVEASESAARAQAEVAQLRALLETGQIIEISRKLRAIVRADDAREDHYRLLGQLSFMLGDYEQAIAILQNMRAATGANEEDDILLMKSHLAQGDNQQALSFGRSLLSDERETDEILEASAIAAGRLGFDDETRVYWERLMRSGEQSDLAASAMLALLLRTDDHDGVIKLADQILLGRPTHVESIKAKWQVYVAQRDIPSLAALASYSAALDGETTFALARIAWEAGLAKPAAAMIAPQLKQPSPDKDAVEWARRMNDQWREAGQKALDAGELDKAADLLQACIELEPAANPSIRARRALEQRFRADLREAFVGKDYRQVMKLTRIALQYNITFSGFDRIVGRSAAELGDYGIALPHLQKVADMDATVAARLQFARIAVKAKDYLQALRAYNAIVADAETTDAQREEAVRAVNGMFSATVRAARESIDVGKVDQAWQLLKLLSRHCDKTERIKQEQGRIIRQLRAELKVLDPADHAARLELANTILSLDPGDIGVRRIAAGTAMRIHNFAEAREHWRTLARQDEMTPQIEAVMAKCDLWISREQARKSA